MTIDDHIKVLKSYYHGFTGCAGNLQDSIDVAVDIMHKYQKIEEIYKNWCYPTYFNATDAMNKLGEVLKDGND